MHVTLGIILWNIWSDALEQQSNKKGLKQKCSKNVMSNGFVFILPSQEPHDRVLWDILVTRDQMNHYRAAAETAQSELAALSVKYDCAQSEVHLKIISNPSPNLRVFCSHLI